MARITIKQLEERLKKSEDEVGKYYRLWQEAKDKLEERNNLRNARESERESAAQSEIRHLMEIIRILSKDPRLTIEVSWEMRDRMEGNHNPWYMRGC